MHDFWLGTQFKTNEGASVYPDDQTSIKENDWAGGHPTSIQTRKKHLQADCTIVNITSEKMHNVFCSLSNFSTVCIRNKKGK